MAQLILDKVSKRFAQTPVVNEVSLAIEPGTFVALLGPSGCGKTTVLRMIAGFERVDAGCIRLDQQVLSSPTQHLAPEQRQMSMVFQSYALWPHMNVLDNVGYALKLKGVSGQAYQRQVHEALEAVNMPSLAKRMPAELSGGQRQRVALARCLVSAPKVVLLDEPLANLDQHLRASMEQTFREFHQRTQATFIYVTHDQAEAMALADQIAVMHQGQIVQYDSPENLYRQPDTEWTARFIGQGSILYSTVQANGAERLLQGEELMRMLRVAAAPSSYIHSILVRPQHIRVLSAAATPPQASLQALIRERVFKGERYHYHAQVLGNQEIAFYSEQKIALGETVSLQLEQGYLLRG